MNNKPCFIDYLLNNLLGDLNEDGILNILDIVQVVTLILESDYESIVDLNYDGNLDVLDIVIMINIVLEL